MAEMKSKYSTGSRSSTSPAAPPAPASPHFIETSQVPQASAPPPSSTSPEPPAAFSTGAIPMKYSKSKPRARRPPPPPHSRHSHGSRPQHPPQPPLQLSPYEQPPPITAREPEILYNGDVGGHYKGVGCLTKARHNKLMNWMISPQWQLFSVMATMYFFRNNTIHNAKHLTPAQIRGIFSTEITKWHFSLECVWKRLLMRQGHITKETAHRYKIFALAPSELFTFRDWMREIGTFERGGKPFELFEFGADETGKEFVRIRATHVTLTYIQTINAVHDALAQFEDLYLGDEYLRWVPYAPFYNHC